MRGLRLGLGITGSRRSAPELVVDGGFSDTANWTEGAGWSVSGGVLTATGLATGYTYQANTNIVAGKTYAYSFTIVSRTGGDVRCYVGSSPAFSAAQSAAGTYTGTLVATSGGELGINSLSGFTGTIDNLSIKEYP